LVRSSSHIARMAARFGILLGLLLGLTYGGQLVRGLLPSFPAGELAGYLSFSQTLTFIGELHAAAPELVSEAKVMGKSVEGRDVIVFCVGSCTGKASKTFMTALTHSREVRVSKVSQKTPLSCYRFCFCSPLDCMSACKQHTI
jgi:ABC-type xylose transport system permease subunit